jgi:ATP-dependent exoDNAse (exonuclease V) beta subunit
MKTEPPVDHAVRKMALDPHRSFIVQAPAGSGKTGLLTQRFLVLLAGVEHPEEIVAITFTRKAAAEMRDRILGALRLAALDEIPDDAYLRETRELAHAALERDRERGWKLLDNPARLRVRTIDSFCQYLAGQAPLLSGLGSGMGVAEDAAALYQEATRATLEELEAAAPVGDALGLLLRHRDNDSERLTELLADMLGRRDQWLQHLGRGEERLALERALALAVEKGLVEAHRALQPWAGRLMPLLRFAAGNLPDDALLAACRDLEDMPSTAVEQLPCWQGIANLFLTDKNEWRKSLTIRNGFPPGCDEKSRMAELLDELKEQDGLDSLLGRVRSLPAPAYEEGEWQVLEALLRVLRRAAAHLQLVFAAHGQVDFAEIMLRARHALYDEDGPTDLALKLDYRIRHLLVDEFQDTSRNQYELFLDLVAGWQPGDGRSLFLVGDPMQSIYRFREAEVGLFLQAWRHGMGDLPLEPLRLEVNFRSTRGIVDWVNRRFSLVLPAQDDAFSGAVSYAPSVAWKEEGPEPAVEIHPFGERDDRAEADKVLEIVRRGLAEGDGDIAILVRNRSHAAAIAESLNREGLVFQAVDLEGLASRPVVQDLMALSLALLYPADRTSWLALLRGPCCGLSLEDLHTLAHGDSRCVADLLADGERLARLSADGRGRAAGLWSRLAPALADVGTRPLRGLVQGVWLALGGPLAAGESGMEDAEVFFGLLRSLEAVGPVTRERLRDGLERLYARPDGGDGRLQIMTMHKAKGLEFDTVILPGLGRIPRSDGSRLLYWLETLDDQGEARLVLGPIRSAADREDHPASHYIRELEKRKGRYEEGRLLYVAATRAKRRLHLLGHAAFNSKGEIKPASSSLLASLWPALGDYWEALEPPEDGDVGPADTRPQPPLRRLPSGWSAPAVPPPVKTAPDVLESIQGVEFDWAGDLARAVGVVAHRLLQYLAENGVPEQGVDSLRSASVILLRREAVGEDQLEEGLTLVRQALENTLASKRGRWIIHVGHRDARSEYPLTAVVDGRVRHMILDRTFIDEEGVRWIIDYKTGRHEGADPEAFLDREQERYREQLEAYARAFRAMEERPVRVALYYPLMDGWREWEPAL